MILYYRKIASVIALVSTLTALSTPMSAATNQMPSSFFDIPMKTDEQLKAIIDDLPTIRNLRGNGNEFTGNASQSSRPHIPTTPEEIAQEKINRSERHAARRARAKKLINEHQPDPGILSRMPDEDIRRIYHNAIKEDENAIQENENYRWLRGLSSTSTSGMETPQYMAAVDEYYDPWAQGYRMLGGFIDCDHDADGGGSGDNGGNACSRWMMWAAYVNPNYGGGGRDEYFTYSYNDEDDGTTSVNNLDCHSPDTEWELMGVYRQEFYQFIEQISKHLWAIDDYEYVVALAGLAYMSDDDCYGVGYDGNGNYLYAGIQPYTGGMYMIALYTDAQCLTLDTSSGLTFDDFGMTNDMDLGSKDDGCLDDDALSTLYGYWVATQEYTLELLNEVYSEYKYCTLCMDYPTYQDGYFIGDTGTDDDDLINQCWKFHSHDSFTCEAGCIALGDQQGSILQITYDSASYGTSWDGSSGAGSTTVFDHYSKGYTSDAGSNLERFKANAFLTFNGVLFIATFLAFSVARGSRLDSSDKSRSLLSKTDKKKSRSSSRSKKSRRSKSGGSSSRRKPGSSVARSSSRRKTSSSQK